MSRNVILVYDISAVNLIVWWCLFASSMNCVTWPLGIFQIENILSIYLFQTSDLRALWLRIFVSTSAIKIFAKATAILVPMETENRAENVRENKYSLHLNIFH